jgi:hypothetical protein
MTDQAHLERSYRRLLAWYPRAFRREKGQEILAVLLACAPDGQRRPGLAESADLIRSGLWMRLRPTVPGSARTVRAAVRLMCAGAAVSTVNLIVVLAVIVDIMAGRAVPTHFLTAAQVSQLDTQAIVSCLVPVALWLWMARANGRGRNWARILFTVLFGLATLTLTLINVVPPSVIYISFPQSVIGTSFVPAVGMPFVPGLGPVVPVLCGLVVPALTWLAGAAAVWLLWLPASSAFFRPSPGYLRAQYRAQRIELARIRSSRERFQRLV